MLVFGLDTALQRCSVAILRGGEILADMGEDMERGHAERLAPMAAAALARAGVAVADFDRVGVVIGPGGFTGVRVSLSFARGLGVAAKIPVVGVSSLAALAAKAGGTAPESLIASVIDARRGQVYASLHAPGGETLVEPFVASPEQAQRRLAQAAESRAVRTVGTGARLLAEAGAPWRAADAPDQIDAVAVARLAAGAPAPAGPPRPLYLRSPDAKPAAASVFGARP